MTSVTSSSTSAFRKTRPKTKTKNGTASVSANASSMGGSQIFVKEGEEFSVEELLKSTVIASANDAAVALAELILGNI